LEGIGLLIKRGKNHVSWNENPPETAAEVAAAEGYFPGVGRKTSNDDIPSPPKLKQVKNSEEFEEMKKKLEHLKEEERQVDRFLGYLKEQAAVFNGTLPPNPEQLSYLPPNVRNVPEHMYVKFDDITNMPSYKSETVIGIRCPTGTSLEVPDPDQGMKPGERRFEMYLSSKGTELPGTKSDRTTKGEPINVYLVQPRADEPIKDENQEAGAPCPVARDESAKENGKEEEQDEHSVDGKGEKKASDEPGKAEPVALEEEVPKSVSGKPTEEPSDPSSPHFQGPHDHSHHYDTSSRGRDSEYDHVGHSSSRRHEHSYPSVESHWGSYHGYGHSHGDYYPPPHSYSPEHHRRERSMSESRDYYQHPPPGPTPPRSSAYRGDAFRPHPHSYHQGHHEMGRTASAGGDGQHPVVSGSGGGGGDLLNLPLQSPNEHDPYLYPSPGGFGFTPPGGPRESVRAGDVQFPMPSLTHHRDGSAGRDGDVVPPSSQEDCQDQSSPTWGQPPRPNIKKTAGSSRRDVRGRDEKSDDG
jgi:E2F transcription factor CC-MB domain